MTIEDRIRKTLQDWAAEAPRANASAPPTTASRPSLRRPLALAAGLIVAVGVVALVGLAVMNDDDPSPQLQTTPAPSVLPSSDWDAEQYNAAYETIRSAPITRLALADIAEGVTLEEIEGVAAYTVRRGAELRVLLARSPYDGTRIPYCRTSGWFESATHGDKYDETGAPANDLAPRAMAVVPTSIDGDEAVIDLAGLTPGAPATDEPSPQPTDGAACVL